MTHINDLTGQQFGWLRVVSRAANTADGKAQWLCACNCGATTLRTGSSLRKPKLPACAGCCDAAISASKTRHGDATNGGRSRAALHRVWLKMRERCNNPNAREYRWYGGKGVGVCAEWNHYANFRAWALANGWRDIQGVTRGDRMSIDRIDPAMGYSPENCQWITCRENVRRANAKRAA